MPTVFDKLNLKDQRKIIVLNAPPEFEQPLKALRGVTVVRAIEGVESFEFALGFATRRAELDRIAKALCAKAAGDAVLWFAYPKGTSKKYRCDFNRDEGWDVPRKGGFESVRQIAIDEDWSALRFRRVEFVRSTKR
jgi:hypothetical protein